MPKIVREKKPVSTLNSCLSWSRNVSTKMDNPDGMGCGQTLVRVTSCVHVTYMSYSICMISVSHTLDNNPDGMGCGQILVRVTLCIHVRVPCLADTMDNSDMTVSKFIADATTYV